MSADILEQLRRSGVGESCLRHNGLLGQILAKNVREYPSTPKPIRRIRQDQKPLLNQLETRFQTWMRGQYPQLELRPQAKRYQLARGTWYKPDFTAIIDGRETAWECKGPKVFRGGFENLKVAAHLWPETTWFLVWEGEDQAWNFQRILA